MHSNAQLPAMSLQYAASQQYKDALPLLDASRATLERNMGKEYPAAAEASFYIALAHAANPLMEAEKDEIHSELARVSSL